ncbi:MAG: 16S rRNA (guanine(966)-N(2))-methyltransferase RsmD [Gemmatimonadales bacterium]|nr:MAG: 16S rRNA (guanine(966)-N(2))-methyltransferase RsmD [Gemmatimonadales bacterium]
MRIIAGTFRGRRLAAPRGLRIRPTSGRVREAWMNILGEHLVGATVLDLFAGSGALGLEALSRGAASVTFVECEGAAVRVLRSNIASLGVEERATIHRGDSMSVARRLGPGSYDMVLADPPYGDEAATELVRLFRRAPFARILSVEHAADASVEGDATRRYGSTAITFCYAP